MNFSGLIVAAVAAGLESQPSGTLTDDQPPLRPAIGRRSSFSSSAPSFLTRSEMARSFRETR